MEHPEGLSLPHPNTPTQGSSGASGEISGSRDTGLLSHAAEPSAGQMAGEVVAFLLGPPVRPLALLGQAWVVVCRNSASKGVPCP